MYFCRKTLFAITPLIICAFLCRPLFAQQTQLNVDATKQIAVFNPEILGVQAPQWVHDRVWNTKPIDQVPGLKEAYKAAGIKLVRYGGGLETNDTGWERTPQKPRGYDSSGNPISWKPSPNVTGHYHPNFVNKIAADNSYYFNYGTDTIDSIGSFIRSTGINFILQINIDQYDPAMWADLLHYANVEKGYNIKYLELGNELDLELNQNKTTVTPQEYGRRVAGYLEALKAVDPNIKIITGATATAHNGFVDGLGIDKWSEYLIQAAKIRSPSGHKSDSLSYHWYSYCIWDHSGQWPSISDMTVFANPNPARGLWGDQATRSWGRIAPQEIVDKIINPNLPGATLGVTEHNFEACDHNNMPANSNHATAIRAVDTIGRLAYNGLSYQIWYSGYANSFESYSAIVPENSNPTVDQIFIRPAFYALYLYGNYFGNRMIQSSSTNEGGLSIWASADDTTGSTIKIIVTNLTSNPISAPLAVTGVKVNSVSSYVMTNPNPISFSAESKSRSHGTTINDVALDYKNISAIVIPPKKITTFTSSVINNTYPAYSSSAIVINGETTMCPKKNLGDADCNNAFDIVDFAIWRKEYLGTLQTQDADFDTSGRSDIVDFAIWRRSYMAR